MWEALRSGGGIESLVAGTPADFSEWVESWAAKLRWDKDELSRSAQDVLRCSLLALRPPMTLEQIKTDRVLRAQLAGHIKFFAHGDTVAQQGAFTNAFSGEAAYNAFLWKQVEPKGEAFRREL